MLTIDAQVHAYERNHPGRPWHAELTGPREVTGDQMVAAMDAVGVDSAILVSPFTIYRYDASYALEVHERHSARFALVKPVDPANPSVAEVIADWKRTPGAVGVRMLLVRGGYTEDPADPGLNRVLAEAGRLSLPVNLHIAGRLDQGLELIGRNPDTQIIVLSREILPSKLRTPHEQAALCNRRGSASATRSIDLVARLVFTTVFVGFVCLDPERLRRLQCIGGDSNHVILSVELRSPRR
jgi:Amidohydrolase